MLRKIKSWFGPSPVFELKYEGAKLPTRGSKEAAAFDLYAADGWSLGPGSTVIVSTGLRCDFLPGWVALIWDRSCMGSKGIHRFAGVIDSDYRGMWGVVLHNTTRDMFWIKPGDRIAQVVFQRVWTGRIKEGVVSVTERGESGFGSTGK